MCINAVSGATGRVTVNRRRSRAVPPPRRAQVPELPVASQRTRTGRHGRAAPGTSGAAAQHHPTRVPVPGSLVSTSSTSGGGAGPGGTVLTPTGSTSPGSSRWALAPRGGPFCGVLQLGLRYGLRRPGGANETGIDLTAWRIARAGCPSVHLDRSSGHASNPVRGRGGWPMGGERWARSRTTRRTGA